MTRPKPLLLLTYLAFEGTTSRRHLEELFFGDTKDPSDSLTTALRHITQHSATALDVQPATVAAQIECDALLLLEDLSRGDIGNVSARYRGPFLATLNLTLGEELEDWVYTRRDHIAQRVREALLEHAEMQGVKRESVKLVEKAWRLTKGQVIDTLTLNRFYQLLLRGHSSLAHEVRHFAREYSVPLTLKRTGLTGVFVSPQVPLEAAPKLPKHVYNLMTRLEELRHSTYGLAHCLWGEPGIGKSWALEHFSQHLSFPAYSVIATLPSQLAPRHLPRAAALPLWVRTNLSRLAAAEPVTSADAATAVAALLAANAPVVLQVEDLHEANEERLIFWRLLAQAVRRSPGVGLIATSRQPPPDEFDASRLHALTYNEVTSILAAEARSELPAEAVTWIQSYAAGNPLFTLEYFRYLRRRGNLWHDGRSWRWREPLESQLPANVETLILRAVQLLPLSDVDKTVMEAKALLPVSTPLPVLSRVTNFDLETVQGAEHALSKHGVLRRQDFVHPLYRETLVRSLDVAKRHYLAKQIVTALKDEDPETTAPFVADAALPDGTAKELLIRAATKAASHGRRGQAGKILAAAVEYAGNDKNDLRLQAAAYLKHVNIPRARELVEQVLVATPDNFSAILLFAECLVMAGEGQRAETILKRAHFPATAQQRWFEQLVQLRTERNDYQGSVAVWEGDSHRQAASQPASKCAAGFSLLNLGRFAEAEALIQATLSEDNIALHDRASLLETRALLAYYAGNLRESLALFDASISCTRQVTDSEIASKLMHVLRLRATVYWGFFRQADAISDLEESMHLATKLGSGRDYAIAQTYLGIPLTELGEYERAEEALLESREVLRRADAREHLTACEAILGGVYLNWQYPDMAPRALSHTRESLRISKELGAPVLDTQASLYAAWAELIVGDAQRAYTHASHALTVAQKIGQRRVASLCHWMRGLVLERLGQQQQALVDLDRAVDLASEMDLEGHRLLFLVDRDRLRDDPDAVQRHLTGLKPYNVAGYQFPIRQRYLEDKGLIY